MSKIEKQELTSMSITDLQKEKLKELFPEAFTEDHKIDWDKLRLTLGETIDVGKERFGMIWPGKSECFKTIQQPSIATLVSARDESVNFDTTENLFIEGDNLEVLKLLQKSYLGKIKMIYIDPPYNTGNEFIYPDNFSESLETYLEYTGQLDSEGKKFSTNTETDGRFHSKWMNMLYPRLFLARNLLKADGLIFISIDDSEVSNLKFICNEVFGEENFVACLVYDKNRKNDAKYFSVGHEYILVYFKDYQKVFESGTIFRIQKEGIDEVKTEFERLKLIHNGDWSKVADSLKEYYSKWGKDDPRKSLARYTKVDADGPFRDDGNISWPGGGGPKYEVIHPVTKKPCKVPDAGWRFPSKKRMDEEIEKGRVVFGQDESTLPRIRRNLFESDKEVMTSVHYSYAQTATMEFNKIFDNKRVFENPKNYQDIKRLIDYVTFKNDDDIILDFFAGSGTTAHAVLDLNNEDGGNRKFICVQLPEPCDEASEAFNAGYKTIADISKERIRRIINNLVKEQKLRVSKERATLFGEQSTNVMDWGFRVFKLSISNFKIWDSNTAKEPEAIQQALFGHVDHISPEAKQEAILFELLLKSGFKLTTPIEQLTIEGKHVFSIADGLLLICLEKELTNDLIKAIAERQPSRVICLDEGFHNNDQLKTNAVQIMKSKGVLNFRTV
ncbi:MAG: site-specific DNA-methyltransferase [Cyclobacteriaceae bacterium]|nr:site-specific DNA-methyltransferase [Cyclobacteriaceae bacterium]